MTKRSKIPKTVRQTYVPLLRSQQRKLQAERESRIVTATAKKVTAVFQTLRSIFNTYVGENKVVSLADDYKDSFNIGNKTGLNPNGSPDYYMDKLLDRLSRSRTEEVMLIGGIYTFIYNATTRKKWFDAHPVTVIVGIYSWGYRGYNYHWERAGGYIESPIRNYKFEHIHSLKFKIKPQELEDVLRIPTFKPIYRY